MSWADFAASRQPICLAGLPETIALSSTSLVTRVKAQTQLLRPRLCLVKRTLPVATPRFHVEYITTFYLAKLLIDDRTSQHPSMKSSESREKSLLLGKATEVTELDTATASEDIAPSTNMNMAANSDFLASTQD